ncbi:MAG: hypothetical protein COA54_02435 [Thiotrichaceae bacterium]|nr:MAG: hypothetical protein COA54_02435 [Thiotrichaceae bacterium]
MSKFKDDRSWVNLIKGIFARRVVVERASLIVASWESAGAATSATAGASNDEFGTGAVDPANFGLDQLGRSQSTLTDGSSPLYAIHISDAGVHSWIPLNRTYLEIYGGI